jgi:CRP-like cAMP-binding protein
MQESPYLDDNGLLLERLQQLPILGAVSQDHIRQILRLSRIRKFEDGEVITREGEYDLWIYLLFSGAVRILTGKNEVRQIRELGATFGEVAALNGMSRTATVQAIGPTVCLAINVESLGDAKADPLAQSRFVSQLYRLFYDVMAQRLRTKDAELVAALGKLEAFAVELDTVRKSRSALQHELDKLKIEVGNYWIMKK